MLSKEITELADKLMMLKEGMPISELEQAMSDAMNLLDAASRILRPFEAKAKKL